MAESVPPYAALGPGVMLDRYELLCTIAQGGMATVWLARLCGKHGFEKLVAIKTILPDHALDDRFRKMFLDEARIASGIEHPNVAKILDLGEWHDSLYLVMEYVNGDALSRTRRLLSKRAVKMPVGLSLRILADVCSGLHASHELRGSDGELAGVVHRDVSPQNVLIPDNGSAKLIDFGVAKARDRIGGETGGAFTKGKSRYMSPEQAVGRRIDRRADIFAVGSMAYEIFEGASPYEGPNDMARLHALMIGAEVTEVRAAPHPSVEKLIVKALSRDPDKRFATALEMRAALEDAMAQTQRATSDDVAAFFAKHTADRIKERKRIVKLALDGANERQRIREALDQSSMTGARKRSDSLSDQSNSDIMAVPSAPSLEPIAAPPAPPKAPKRPPPPRPTKVGASDKAPKDQAPKIEEAEEISVVSEEPAEAPAAVAANPDHAPATESAQTTGAPARASMPAYASTLSNEDAVNLPPPNRKRGLVAIAVAAGVAFVIGIGTIIAKASHPAPSVEPASAVQAATSPAPTISATLSAMASVAVIPPPPPAAATASTPIQTAMAPTTRPAPPRGTAPKPKGSGTKGKTKATDVVIQ